MPTLKVIPSGEKIYIVLARWKGSPDFRGLEGEKISKMGILVIMFVILNMFYCKTFT